MVVGASILLTLWKNIFIKIKCFSYRPWCSTNRPIHFGFNQFMCMVNLGSCSQIYRWTWELIYHVFMCPKWLTFKFFWTEQKNDYVIVLPRMSPWKIIVSPNFLQLNIYTMPGNSLLFVKMPAEGPIQQKVAWKRNWNLSSV